ncbi:MAG TPA: hypothetical protein VGR35_06090 [Tepidisphaeraceae bacterium]|nr:hypothetical protein [Tepidisphaeraceae bacterium]
MTHRRFIALIPLIVWGCMVASRAAAQTGAELLIRPFAEGENLELNTSAIFQPDGEDDFGGDLGLNVYQVSGRVREVREKSIPRLGYSLTYLDIDSEFAFFGKLLPERLVDQSVAVGLAMPDVYGFSGGFTVGVGYAGDAPFGDANAWYGKATIAMGKNIDENTDLGFFLDYDGNRSYLPDVPLPGFAYRKRLDPKLILVAGVPLSTIEWTPNDQWKFELFWTLIDSFDARVTYTVAPGFNVYANLDSRNHAFHMDELEDANERLLFEETRAELGVQWEPRDRTRVILAGGYAFGQEFSTGWDFRETDEITEVSDAPYARIGLEMRF